MRLKTRSLFGLAAAAPSLALALDLAFLNQAPIRYMSDADVKLMETAVTEVLDQAADGGRSDWQNEETGHSGSVTAVRSFSDNGMSCRTIQIDNRVPQATQGGGSSTHDLCKVGGEWKILR